jgi:sec-independent protein translocase protein TatB
MFGLSFAELLVILLVGILVIGPKDMPKVIRHVGKFLHSIRRLGDEIKSQMYDAVGMDEMHEIHREIEQAGRHIVIDDDGNEQVGYDLSELLDGETRSSPSSAEATQDKQSEEHIRDSGS